MLYEIKMRLKTKQSFDEMHNNLHNKKLCHLPVKDESGKLDPKKCSEVSGTKSIIENDPEKKGREYNKQLHKDRHNIELWKKFVNVQVIIYRI